MKYTDPKKVVAASSLASDYVKYAQVLSAGRGRHPEMKAIAERVPSQRVREVVLQKATAVDVGSSTDATWAGPLNQMAAAFLDLLAPFSAFDRLVADFALVSVPLNTRITIASTGATAGQLFELAPTPISEINFGVHLFEPVKIASSVVISQELSRLMTSSASRLIGNELRKAIALATDVYFTDVIAGSTGAASSSSSGMTASAFLSDLETALQSITTSPSSRLYLLVSPSAFKTISLLRDTGGSLMTNGTIASGLIRVVPTSALSDTMVLADAASIAGTSQGLELLTSDEATVEISDSPTSGNATRVSLFQHDLVCLRALRYLAVALLRADAVAVVTSVTA